MTQKTHFTATHETYAVPFCNHPCYVDGFKVWLCPITTTDGKALPKNPPRECPKEICTEVEVFGEKKGDTSIQQKAKESK